MQILLRQVVLRSIGGLGIRTMGGGQSKAGMADWQDAKSIFDFSAVDIDGNDVQLSKYKDKVSIVVNVASKWGATDRNYRELVELHERYVQDGLAILAFPCNQFGNQEPGTDAEIKAFAAKYNVKFDMFSKINVNGEEAHPLWKWLKMKKSGFLVDAIKWNFTKFLCDRDGQPIERFATTANPLSMEDKIKTLLQQTPKGSKDGSS